MKTNRWIIAILVASFAWTACDEDEDNPINKPELPDADETFVEFAARSNKGEIEFGELAVTKATDSLVKAFAQQMIDEHTTAQTELKDIADDYDDIDWPNDLTDDQDSIMAQLENASGYTFDTLYMKSQVILHEGTANNFDIGATNATNARVKAYANKYLPHIEMHLAKADSIHTVMIENNTTADSGVESGAPDTGAGDDGTADDGTSDGGDSSAGN